MSVAGLVCKNSPVRVKCKNTPEAAQDLLDISYDISLILRIISHDYNSVIRKLPTTNDIPQLLSVRGSFDSLFKVCTELSQSTFKCRIFN